PALDTCLDDGDVILFTLRLERSCRRNLVSRGIHFAQGGQLFLCPRKCLDQIRQVGPAFDKLSRHLRQVALSASQLSFIPLERRIDLSYGSFLLRDPLSAI